MNIELHKIRQRCPLFESNGLIVSIPLISAIELVNLKFAIMSTLIMLLSDVTKDMVILLQCFVINTTL